MECSHERGLVVASLIDPRTHVRGFKRQSFQSLGGDGMGQEAIDGSRLAVANGMGGDGF